MKIEFKRVKIHGFMSYLDAELELSDNGFVFIQGVNENPDDNAASNGAGKSTISDSIAWILTGETIRGTKNVVSKYTEDGTYGMLEFDVDGHNYVIIRSKDHKQYKTNLQIFLDGKDISAKGIRDSEKVLQQYLPDINSSLLGSVIILGQGLPQKFTNNTPSGRKEVLEKLSKSDFMIEDLKNRVGQRRQVLSAEQRKCEDAILSYESSIKTLEQQLQSLASQLNSLGSAEQYDAEIESLQKDIVTIDGIINTATSEGAQIQEKLNTLTESLNTLSASQNAELLKIDDIYRNDINTLNENKNALQAKIYALQKEITQIESIVDICPTCKQKIPNVSKPDTTEKKEELARLRREFDSCSNDLKSKSDALQAEKVEYSLRAREEQSKYTKDINTYRQSVADYNSKLREQTQAKIQVNTRLQQVLSTKSQLESRKKFINDSIEDSNKKIKDMQDKSLYINNEKETLKLHLDVITKFETVIKRDFRGYLLNNVIDYINKKSKEYSMDVFGTDLIEFSLNGNNINIAYDGKEYDCLSGGEKQKVDVIVQFALRDMLCTFLGFSSNILFLDEITDNLDYVGCQKVIDLISKKLNDIDSVYIISHHSDLSIPIDKEIMVVKSKDGVSRIL